MTAPNGKSFIHCQSSSEAAAGFVTTRGSIRPSAGLMHGLRVMKSCGARVERGCTSRSASEWLKPVTKRCPAGSAPVGSATPTSQAWAILAGGSAMYSAITLCGTPSPCHSRVIIELSSFGLKVGGGASPRSSLPTQRLLVKGCSFAMISEAHASLQTALRGTLSIEGVIWILVIPGLRMSTPLITPIDGPKARICSATRLKMEAAAEPCARPALARAASTSSTMWCSLRSPRTCFLTGSCSSSMILRSALSAPVPPPTSRRSIASGMKPQPSLISSPVEPDGSSMNSKSSAVSRTALCVWEGECSSSSRLASLRAGCAAPRKSASFSSSSRRHRRGSPPPATLT
mmetsp:Transcript_9179/g.22841  ORF Transcript_9179/g.22841 Transcript_9179/m.22841 type:complete len:345 (+) Transcript_9179:76-1110(+)